MTTSERNELAVATYRDKVIGCFLGGAIGDAMGGPPEAQHWRRIARMFPDFQTFMPYDRPASLIDLQPGYALESAPGNVTDDTYIRIDFTRFVMSNETPFTASKLAAWMVENADFAGWYRPAVNTLQKVRTGEVSAEDAGLHYPSRGGGAWWQPIAVTFGGDPAAAGETARDICRIWKGPLEQDILSSMVAGHAAAFTRGASVQSVADTIIASSGPLAAALFTRAAEIAVAAKSPTDLYERLYQHCLVPEIGSDADGPMPPHVEPIEDSDEIYISIMFAEQQPFALAYLLYGAGDPYKTVLTAAKGGRDADSIASVAASLLGALHGADVWPREWLATLEDANSARFSLHGLANSLADRGLALGHVALDSVGPPEREDPTPAPPHSPTTGA